MDRINQASFDPPSHDPTQRLPKGPSLMFDPGEIAFVAAWLGHLAAGRVGGNPPMSDERKAEILANERVVMGPRWRG
jgi:hypothetical protein